MRVKSKVRNIICISDSHCGCQLGLCPPKIPLENGGSYRHSRLQSKVWNMWNEFWKEWVPMATEGEDYVVVHNGDAIDGIHHNSVTQITHNIEDQKLIAYEAMKPIVSGKKCKEYFHIRGTEAHVGSSGQHEESLAKALGAIPDENKNYARWDLWLQMNSALVHFTHHIGNTSSAAYESTAVYKELVEAYNEAGRWNNKPPDVIVRSHRHRQMEIRIPTDKGYGISIVTPGWQLRTPFTYRIGLGRSSTPQIGGYLIRCGDEEFIYSRFKIWKLGRTKAVTI
jgi:hypothetical protein